MSKPLVVLADEREDYLQRLEYKFVECFEDNIELEVISDPVYFQKFFERPKTAEIVVTSETLFSSDLRRHNIAHLFILTEEDKSGDTEELDVTRVFRYAALKEIFNELTYQSRDLLYQEASDSSETQVITLFSAIGGSGKTALSLGLASALATNHKRVLYLNTESIQGFGTYLTDGSGFTNEGYRAIREDEKHMYHNMKYFLRKEGFAYVPPFSKSLDAVGLTSKCYVDLVRDVKESKEYDFIIVDIEAGYSRTRAELLQEADKVIMVMLQDQASLFKTQWILDNMDFRDPEKYLFICNKYDETKENAYSNSKEASRFPLHERIALRKEEMRSLRDLERIQEVQKLAYMFI